MFEDNVINPIVKWAGGKRQLLQEIMPLINRNCITYVEPFLGGGAVFFALQPQKAIINDLNSELMNVYAMVRDFAEDLINELEIHEKNNCEDYYYEIRALDRMSQFSDMSCIQKAARILYLNKTCYNGLYRVNASGQFNSPYGRYKNPNIVNASSIRIMSRYLQSSHIDIRNSDYREVLEELQQGTFVYLDPPYMPLSSSASFTGYTEGEFSYEHQMELKKECDKLRKKGISFLQSNSDCLEIRELYQDYKLKTVQAKRNINSKSQKRGEVNELLIYYED